MPGVAGFAEDGEFESAAKGQHRAAAPPRHRHRNATAASPGRHLRAIGPELAIAMSSERQNSSVAHYGGNGGESAANPA
ncbi:hypothetical protein [Lysobacter sp. Hz 25]|uniref:hypothetical protein n=1 Tax=Lysobacter sp. Hz 25 TaxID=3383698 RepID=UPI0038D50D50